MLWSNLATPHYITYNHTYFFHVPLQNYDIKQTDYNVMDMEPFLSLKVGRCNRALPPMCLANSPTGESGSQSFLFNAVTLNANANKLKSIIFNIFHMVVKVLVELVNINGLLPFGSCTSGEPTTGEATVGPGLESVCFLVNSPVEDPPEVELPYEEHRCEEVTPAF